MKKNFLIDRFNNLRIFDINLEKLRSKNFHKDMIRMRNTYYKKYNKFLINKKIKCNLCKKNNNKIFLKWKNYILYRCIYCGAVFNNIDIKKFSKYSNFHSNNTRYEDFKRELVRTFNYRKKNFGVERYNYIKKKILNKKKNFKILDYGCGAGSFLSVLNDKKIFCKGIDLDKNAVEFCKQKKLNVTLNDINFEPNNYYDLITMFDTIEHFYDPIKEMRSVVKKIKKKSFLLAFTPNIHSLSFELMKDEHNMFSVFDHMIFFNLKSLNYLSNKIGLKIISIEYFGFRYKRLFSIRRLKKKYQNK